MFRPVRNRPQRFVVGLGLIIAHCACDDADAAHRWSTRVVVGRDVARVQQEGW